MVHPAHRWGCEDEPLRAVRGPRTRRAARSRWQLHGVVCRRARPAPSKVPRCYHSSAVHDDDLSDPAQCEFHLVLEDLAESGFVSWCTVHLKHARVFMCGGVGGGVGVGGVVVVLVVEVFVAVVVLVVLVLN